MPGSLNKVKAIGWFIKEYGVAQVSMNITDISVTPVHLAFDEVCRKAEARGVRVTGSELVGLIPLKSLLDAGRYFLEKQQRSAGVSDDELIKIAIRSMGLNELHPFIPEEKVIEYMMKEEKKQELISLNLKEFMNLTASESPVPGGGSVSAYMGAMGVSLGTMVANLSSHKKGWDDRWKEFSDKAVKGKEIQEKLLQLVDADTEAFNKILEARRLPKSGPEEIKIRDEAINSAYREAIIVPFRVMETAYSGFAIIKDMVENGIPSSVSDAAVGSLALLACVKGAHLNIKINVTGMDDKEFINEILARAKEIEAKSILIQEEITQVANTRISL